MKEPLIVPFFEKSVAGRYVATFEPQEPIRVERLIVDGMRSELTPRIVLPGQRYRVDVASLDACAAIEAMAVETFGGREKRSIVLGGKVDFAGERGNHWIRPGESVTADMRVDEPARVKKIEASAVAVCGTCRGRGVVGFEHHHAACPTCKGDPDWRAPRRAAVVCTGVFNGTRLEVGSCERVPIEALESVARDVVLVPGVIFRVELRNDDTAPVYVDGCVTLEEIPSAPWPEMPTNQETMPS